MFSIVPARLDVPSVPIVLMYH